MGIESVDVAERRWVCGYSHHIVNTSCVFRRLTLHDDKAFCDLVSAIIVQAAIDWVESYKCGLINNDNTVNSFALEEFLRCSYPSRCPLPKWMEPRDVYSSATFLFSVTLDEIIPENWQVSPDAVRRAVISAASSQKVMNHFFNFDTQ